MRELTLRDALNEALRQEMHRDSTVFVAGEDVGVWNGCFQVTKGLYDEFGPERVMDTPLSEAAIIGIAVGSAATGLRPVVELMEADFAAVCFDQIVNQAAKMHYMFGGQIQLPLVIRMVNGGGGCAAAQHSQSWEALYSHIPGLKVVMPSTAYDAKGLLLASIRDNNPVVFIEHSLLYSQRSDVPEEDYVIPLGKADVKREGKDVTIVAYSCMVPQAMAAAKALAGQGIEAEIVDPRTISPLDMDTIIKSVKKTHNLVIAHEAVLNCGVGAEIAAQVAQHALDYLDTPIVRVAAPFAPVPFSPVLEQAYRPDKNSIVKAVRGLLNMDEEIPA